MDKYNRVYQLFIQRKDGTTLKLALPFTVEFDITRNSFTSANVAQIRIYNLSLENRSQIRKDQFDTQDLRLVSLLAGYGDNLSLAFNGSITQAWSVREGVDVVTTIESFDGGYAFVNAVTANQFPENTAQRSIIDSLAKSLPGVALGAIGSFPGSISRGNSYNGNTLDVLSEITGGACFIDNGKIHCLSDSECLDGSIPTINAQNGLLGTPIKETTYINFDMLFEPGLRIGQLIRLDSQSTDAPSIFNGVHKIISVKHRGTISAAVCGSAITSVGLLPGQFTTIPEAAA